MTEETKNQDSQKEIKPIDATTSASPLERHINVSVPADRIQAKIFAKLKELAPKVKIPGFRPGKVPFSEIQKRFENDIRNEVIADVIRESYLEAIGKEKFEPATWPKIDITSSGLANTPLNFTATFEVFPQIKLADFSNITMEKEVGVVTDADLDWMIEKMRKQQATWIEVTNTDIAAQPGCKINIEFDITIESEPPETVTNENIEFELGTQQMWQEFEEKLIGHKVGDEVKFALTFPASHLQKQFAGKKVNYIVRIKKILAANLPELNDEFVQKLGFSEGGLAGLRENIKKFMETQLNRNLEQKINKIVLEKIAEITPIELPRSLVEAEIQTRSKEAEANLKKYFGVNNSPELNREFFEQKVRKDITMGLIIAEIIKTQKLEVDSQKLRDRVQELIDRGDNKKITELSQNKKLMNEFKAALLEEEAIDFIKKQIPFTEKQVSYRDIFDQKAPNSINDEIENGSLDDLMDED